jgi:hypothetical protein
VAAVVVVPCMGAAQSASPKSVNVPVIVGANVAIGASTATLYRIFHHKRIRSAFFIGGGGGLAIAAGKWIVGRNAAGTTLGGRTLAAVGASVIRNAGEDRPLFKDIAIPYGPLRFNLNPSNAHNFPVKVDPATSVILIHELRVHSQRFDSRRSVLSGIPTFHVDSSKRGGELGGSHVAGVITFRSATPFEYSFPHEVIRIIGHEQVHVLQNDFLYTAVAAPIEDRLADKSAITRVVRRYIDFGIQVPIWSALNSAVVYQHRPWEREAVTFAGR